MIVTSSGPGPSVAKVRNLEPFRPGASVRMNGRRSHPDVEVRGGLFVTVSSPQPSPPVWPSPPSQPLLSGASGQQCHTPARPRWPCLRPAQRRQAGRFGATHSRRYDNPSTPRPGGRCFHTCRHRPHPSAGRLPHLSSLAAEMNKEKCAERSNPSKRGGEQQSHGAAELPGILKARIKPTVITSTKMLAPFSSPVHAARQHFGWEGFA